jgi:hypothetical protein
MKIKLWTIQDQSGWNQLQTKGRLIARKEFIDADFKEAYDWMKMQMTQRIGKPNKQNHYPVWAWYQYIDKVKKRPDLRATGHLPSGTTGYRIEIEKETKDVLLSDFDLWHTPLFFKNFIANSEKEYLEFESELKRNFDSDSFNDLPPKIRRKIEKSWEKIFDMDFAIEYIARPFEEKQIQATFWELKTDEIVEVDKFKAR